MGKRLFGASLGAALILLLSGPSSAATFSAPIPALVGPLRPPDSEGHEGVFDFGFEFSEIESVSIEIEARIIAQEREVCGALPPCASRRELLALFAEMNIEDSTTFGIVLSDELVFGDILEDPEGFGTESAIFRNTLIGWTFLLDGEGLIKVFWNVPHGIPGRIVKQPSGEILSARIIVQGTAVPEPSTVLMIGLGLVGLASRRRCK